VNHPSRADASGRAYLDLQHRARLESRGTQELLTLYVVERWLARLSHSTYADNFVLKGGMLLAAYGQRRPTADADTLARFIDNDAATLAIRVADIAALPDQEDGVEFLPETMTSRVIRNNAAYSGIRVSMHARIATATIVFRIDINTGDPITPAPDIVELPALRPGFSPIRVLGYPVETILAEKIATAIDLGEANTRVRDYVDIYT
jgi:hypothetical protein